MKKFEVEKILSVLKRIPVGKIENADLKKKTINAILFLSRMQGTINNELMSLEETYFGNMREELKLYVDALQSSRLAKNPIEQSQIIRETYEKYPTVKVADENFGQAKEALLMETVEGYDFFSLEEICDTGLELSGKDIVTLTPIIS